MRELMIIGFILVLLGILAVGFQDVTFYTQERVVDAGPLKIDIERPHTIVFHPFAAGAAIVIGVALLIIGARSRPTG